MTTAIGDVYLIYQCPNCAHDHEHHLMPVDRDAEALGVATEVAWIYERAVGATQCRLLLALEVAGHQHLVAVRHDLKHVWGNWHTLPLGTTPPERPLDGYNLAMAQGAILPPVGANEPETLILGQLSRVATVDRLLTGVRVL
jgi:hypothetical protein